ncbi:pyrroline-5-carboxylate reductase [Mesorhizobium sp. B2-4-19]|uniref:pyrroline-5-carboxylate reductase n=1 Tax=Mesorhizobium sp. B2-4-19 TaxID=2589930 RepID=UPI00112CB18E|nr:pyrroline-5-carboxylate reductase [Mesorhizobium sp. B2-4-19]TPK60070.1 pyrroline-5-carboxylate reductase [Mesorhizobium sp. B2-4-19]
MTMRLVLAGCGNMGYAMLCCWHKAGKISAREIMVVEPSAELRLKAETLGCQTAENVQSLPADTQPELVVLAVKPQVIRTVAESYKRFGGGNTTFLSIAAGVSVSTLREVLGATTPIVRCMPNTPASIGKGMMVVFSTPQVQIATSHFINDLLSTSGAVASIADESLMDAVTAVSGSGPAYIFYFIECLSIAAEKAGLPADTARLLAMQTVNGAASLAAESNEEPAILRRQVTSPNGTTAAALGVLMSGNRLQSLIEEAVGAARRRSIELGRE